MAKYRADDLNLLLPSFREATVRVIERLRAQGFDPIPFDTLRTPEEALRNAKRGSGILDSIHLYGCACDVICGVHGWSCKASKCKFYTKLGAAVEAEGLVWGGRFPSRVDLPHFQGIAVREQKAMRDLGRGEESAAARDKLTAKSIAGRLKLRG